MIDFDAVQEALRALGANADAAESHGTLCALLLGDVALPVWLEHTLDEAPAGGDVLAREQSAVLEELYTRTAAQLEDGALDFTLLLPEDDEDFDRRLRALAGWCQGFLYGLAVTGAAEREELDDDTREGLSDLLEISKLAHDEEASDEAEQQFMELVEHVRLVVMMMSQALEPPAEVTTVH